ncbi:MAG: hypothetical protein WBJ19_16820 [Rhodoferax sp.]
MDAYACRRLIADRNSPHLSNPVLQINSKSHFDPLPPLEASGRLAAVQQQESLEFWP